MNKTENIMYKDFTKYEVFEDGKIWSYKTKKFLKPATDKGGYQRVFLSDNDGKRKWYFIHRIVYEAVSGEPIPEGMQVNHINEDKTDNRFFENLNLMTCKQNNNWGTRNERLSKQVGAFQNGELIMSFHSTMEAERNGFKHSAVSKCCNDKLPHYKGYVWKYI